MHKQIVSSETGGGPIYIVYGDAGKTVKFRKLKMKTTSLHELIEHAFQTIVKLYPTFEASSAPE